MDRNELTATRWFGARLTPLLLAGVGLLFFLEPDWLASSTGGRDRVQGFGVFCAFVGLAMQSWEISKLRVEMAVLMEALNQLLYGKNYRRDREAIEILLRSLEEGSADAANTAYTHLVRLTGQNLARDPAVWRAWWNANKQHFERSRGSPSADETA
jgi:hypothetical protein